MRVGARTRLLLARADNVDGAVHEEQGEAEPRWPGSQASRALSKGDNDIPSRERSAAQRKQYLLSTCVVALEAVAPERAVANVDRIGKFA